MDEAAPGRRELRLRRGWHLHPHLSGAYLAARGGFAAAHVLFRGAAQTIPAMLAGDVHFAVDNLASYVPVIREGRMRALAVAGGPGPSSRADHPETV